MRCRRNDPAKNIQLSFKKKKKEEARFRLLVLNYFLFLQNCKYNLTNSSILSFHVTTRLGCGSVLGGLKSCYVLPVWATSLSTGCCNVVFLSEKGAICFRVAKAPPSFTAGLKLWIYCAGGGVSGRGGGRYALNLDLQHQSAETHTHTLYALTMGTRVTWMFDKLTAAKLWSQN